MKILVLGGGLTGLIAAYVLRRSGDVTLVDERPKIGISGHGPLRHLRRTAAMGDLLDSLGVAWKAWRLRGGILLDDEIRPHPALLRQMPTSERRVLQSLYWERTRGRSPHDHEWGDVESCMGNPMVDTNNDMAISLECDEFARLIAHRALRDDVLFLVGSKIIGVTERTATIVPPLWWKGSPRTVEIPYDRLVVTLPLPTMASLAPWACLPTPVIEMGTLFEYALPDLMVSALDYVYTPTLQKVTKVSWPRRGTLLVEAPGSVEPNEVEAELREPLFPLSCRRHVMADEPKMIRQHITELVGKPAWPEHWLPLGRYAEWSPSRTTEQVLDRVLTWSQSITGP